MPREFSSNQKSKKSKKSEVSGKKLRIGVLCGGNSSERKISLRSGRAVYSALQRAGFGVLRIDPRNWTKASRALKTVDVAFVALHGRGGEDGVIQKRLEKAGIPYIGSGASASLKAFDKEVSKNIFLKYGIPSPKGFCAPSPSWAGKLSALKFPLFVKPCLEGSSIGAYSIEDFGRAAEKIKRSVASYGKVLVEEKIIGREFTVGILGAQALPVVEMKPRRAFYDYRAKYTKGMTQYQVPAKIPASVSRKLQKLALKVHGALGLRDFSRVDILMDRKGKPYVLEANSIPGFTELSLLPKAAQAAGISFEALCSRLVGFARRRAQAQKKLGD